MASVGSYTGSNGDFNPASYTRHFLGSPISWRAGSFGAKIPSGSPTAHFLSSFDQNTVRVSSSIDGERTLLNALSVFDREGELCRNYTCCGLHLNDLHTLLEHFEDVHLVVLDPTAAQPQAHVQVPFNPQSHPPLDQRHQPSYYPAQISQQPYQAPSDPDEMELELDLDNTALHYPPQHQQPPPPPSSILSSAHSSPSSGVPTPPDTPISTPLSSYPSPASISHQQHLPLQAPSPYTSQPSSPHAATFDPNRRSSNSPPSVSVNGRPNLNLNLTAANQFSARGMMQQHVQQAPNPEDAFNPYARFASDYSSCLPGAQYNPAPTDDASMHPGFNSNPNGANVLQSPHLMHLQHGFMGQQQLPQGQPSQGVAPALLFSSNATTPCSTPATSRVPSPTSSYPTLGLHPNALSQGNTPISSVPSTPISPTSRSPTGAGKTMGLTRHASTSALNTSATLRATSSLLLSKPFKCPKPNCNKSYKQANGLKYHITHGSCNFAPPKDLEHVKDLLERKRRDKERAAAEGGASLSQGTSAEEMSDLTAISESELREVEREAEKRLRPYACGVGDCQRRYKNMNGLRYHYQHSGEHGAVGLTMLANGQHECLAGSSRHHGHSADNEKRGSLSSQGSVDREGRRRVVTKGGSASVPVSRAASTSRTGTPVPMSAMAMGFGFAQQQQQQPTQAQPFTPPSTQMLTQQLSMQQQQQHSQSHPSSPTHSQPQHMQQQQQLAYQHYASLQRQQYALQQQQFAAMYHQQHQQHQQGMGLDGSLGG
ncbi:hypothetical protein BDN72DRAFT_861730 [Pluteus cervinus]|uniref:Uncharacterized protein n=1 Tax=Pluteus cervinus TaxID=181527 RepID=A0ACD3ADX8_9AGAR|nr:hypothetical protein BDN72DRAFT_861730 [Pluteus cervinus]